MSTRASNSKVKISRFREFKNPVGTMLAFFSAELPSGMVLHGLRLMAGPRGRRWIAMPDIKRRDQDDRPVTGEGGKPVYDPVIEFRDRSARDKFSALLLDALRAEHPEAFDEEGRP
jgi:DNA-binding cell septation regulator SpoVG